MSTRFIAVVGETVMGEIWCYEKHKAPITGFIETGGAFNGGKLSFYISLSGGDFINPWVDMDGLHYQVEAGETREFTLPLVNRESGAVTLYYSFLGNKSPDVRITLGDNT